MVQETIIKVSSLAVDKQDMSLKNSVSQKIWTVTVALCNSNGIHQLVKSTSAQILLLKILCQLRVIVVLDYARMVECAQAVSVIAQKDTPVNIALQKMIQIQASYGTSLDL